MNNIEELFLPYNESLKLKSIGFDEPCFGVYYANTKNFPIELEIRENKESNSKFIRAKAERLCIAPLYSQAFKFFREKYGLSSWIKEFNGARISYHFTINFRDKNSYDTLDNNLEFNSYEKAELECIKKLIKIVKENVSK